eukprot:SAG22_NODE_110_length_19679_cov_45.046527_3_plen_77_part_00
MAHNTRDARLAHCKKFKKRKKEKKKSGHAKYYSLTEVGARSPPFPTTMDSVKLVNPPFCPDPVTKTIRSPDPNKRL